MPMLCSTLKVLYLQTVITPESFSCKNTSSNVFFHEFAELVTVFSFNSSNTFLQVIKLECQCPMSLTRSTIINDKINCTVRPFVSSSDPLPLSPSHVYSPVPTKYSIEFKLEYTTSKSNQIK